MIKRTIEKRINEYLNSPVISISGPRQSGKTTLCKKIFKNYKYFNLENPETRRFAQDDPNAFLASNSKIIIDEIQRVPDLFSYIQTIVDEDKNRRFVITGSQNLLISEKISQSLAGRVAIFKLLPLSISELKKAKLLPENLNHLLWSGSYPRIYDRDLNPKKWYEDYIETYLERDVRAIKSIADLGVFHKFLTLLAGRTGQVLNMSSLSNDVGVSVNTISDWISILEASFLIVKLKPYFGNINKRIIKAPKVHFLDSGIICSLLNINTVEQLESHPLIGHIFESFIVSDLIKKNYNSENDKNFYHLRDKVGREIDLILQEANRLDLIEVKYSQTFNDSFVKDIDYFSQIFTEDISSSVIYGGNLNQNRSNFKLVPWDKVDKISRRTDL